MSDRAHGPGQESRKPSALLEEEEPKHAAESGGIGEALYRATGGQQGTAPMDRIVSERRDAAADATRRMGVQRIFRKAQESAQPETQESAQPEALEAEAEEGEKKEVSQPGEAAEVEADEKSKEVADKLHGGGGDKEEETGGEKEQEKTISQSAPEVGTKLYLAKDDKDNEHRGRLQVQGNDLKIELSWPWAGSAPPTADAALAGLAGMKAQLNEKQLARRSEAFDRAEQFIRSAQKSGGVSAPVSQSYQNRNVDDKTARVDIEVRKGKAFV